MNRWNTVSVREAQKVEGGGNNWYFAALGLFLVAAYAAQWIYLSLSRS